MATIVHDNTPQINHILATHSPNGTHVDVKSLMQIIEGIMHRANFDGSQARTDANSESVTYYMSQNIKLAINKVRCEISCKCTKEEDITIGIFKTLSNYEWNAKVVIALAAFTVNYGEFWLMAQLHTTNPLAELLARLKPLPGVLDTLKPTFDEVTNLVKVILDLIDCIIKIQRLPKWFTSPGTSVTTSTDIPTTVYWIIRSIVACASILTNLIEKGHALINQASELSNWAQKISNIYDQFNHQLVEEEAYQTIIHIMGTTHHDNMKPLEQLIFSNEPPLYKRDTQTRVSIDALREKTVLLLISELEFPSEELSFLNRMYMEARQNPTKPESRYEVVWLPVVLNHATTMWTKENKIKFETLRNDMPWYSLFHPSLLNSAAIRYIKEVWHFNHKPLLVVMNSHGRIVNTNALHMMWIWGNVAFPFTSSKEEDLWRNETWRIELLVELIEPKISKWVAEGKYICLYGGEDIEWIRRFTKTLSSQAEIQLEMLYVGKSNPGKKVKNINDIISKEKLSHVLPNLTCIRSFWVRLQIMLHSKLGKSFNEDPILKEINLMLTYDGNGKGWAVICRGSNEWIMKTNVDTLLASLANYNEWREKAKTVGFFSALKERLEANRPSHHCNHLVLPGYIGSVLETVVCADCGQSMEKFFLYRCCTD